ncbi:hypothetical protein ASF41_18575 [Methylobacterium sp. Leaf111]|uniref:EAL domain-containing protein n=1 Tax=Methylobacterium sp. Leaf111 TaxID=1736257 RepID=UPI0006FB3DFB|nr:EAL domain-containing protein [Methylobacterium sp. Leaf111]KQP73475.1 hypothetical protein ASF41_18575 [Methylobacterium sp. Leaf111]
MLGETLQLGRYSAFTQATVALSLAAIFWDIAAKTYLAVLAAAVTTLCGAAIVATPRYRGVIGGGASCPSTRGAFRVLHLLAFGRGLAWATMPAVLLPTLDNAYRVVVGAVCAALISHAYVAGPVFSLALLAVVPVVAGIFIGLAGCEGPVGHSVALLLTLYATFVFVSARRLCGHAYQRIRNRVVVQAQSETIELLLKDFAEGTSDWLWEIDTVGRLRPSLEPIAGLLGVDPVALRHRTLQAVLRDFADEAGGATGIDAVLTAIAARSPFRDHTVRLRTRDGRRWLTLNGRPVFDALGTFVGYRGVGSDVTASREAQARIAFPFDKVKVDRSFVRDLQGRPEKVAVVEAIARMARALSMNVTVEGVETQAQLDVLRAKRCDVAQGFLYSPARPASEVMALIDRIEATSSPVPDQARMRTALAIV